MQQLFVISGPSGSGQDTVIEELSKILPLERVITTTTRPSRPNEAEGKPYYFVSRETFEEGLKESRFIEHATGYNGELYGVTREELSRIQTGSKIGIWKVEFQGAKRAKELFPTLITILITAPLEVIEERLRHRDHPEEHYLQERMLYTKRWYEHFPFYDYTISNENGHLQEAVQAIKAIIEKHTQAT